MHSSSTVAVRLLAAWQQRRRELSDRLDGLLLHGPTAVDRVAARAPELRAAIEAERQAFEAFVLAVGDPASALPAPAPREQEPDPAYPRLHAVRSDA